MDINGVGVLLNLLTNMGEGDLMLSVKAHEALGLQKHMPLLSQLSAFETLLNNFYGISCPSTEDYANRRDLVRIYNEIAKEIYGNNNNGCPVVEEFGSFLMDIFSPRSDLDLSINFSDKLFEVDRMSKIKTLRKFAKKFFALRRKGHLTTVELILSARVPVLKVTDKGSGIECDFSVGNRDGIAKSHIVLLISAIDERFKKLSFLFKAWAKAQDINSSKDGTLNSISLILLVAFHLQTREVPILPPFSAIFKDGMDPMAVNLIPSFLNYGQRNKETLAELFVSLLVKLQSVENLWSKGLCASTYEGSWVYKDWKATGCIRIEDFSDRSENTARAVKSKNLNKIYSAIRRSLDFIRVFTEGKLDAGKLKSRLFEAAPSKGKQVHTTVNNLKLSKPVKVSPNSTPKKKKLSGQVGLEGQKPGKQVKLNPCSSKPTPKAVKALMNKRKKSEIGLKTDTQTSNTATSFQVSNTPPETLSRNPLPLSHPPIQGPGGPLKVAQSFNTRPTQNFGESGHLSRNPLPLSDPPIQGPGGPMKVAQSFNTLPTRSFVESGNYSLSRQPIEQYERYRSQVTHAPNFPSDQPQHFPTQNFQSSTGFSLDQPFQHSNHSHLQGYHGQFTSQRSYVDRQRDGPPNFPSGPTYSLSNSSELRMSDSFTRRSPRVMHSYQPNLHTVSHRNPSELSTPMSDPYNLGSRTSSVTHPYHPNLHTVSHRNPSELNPPMSDPYDFGSRPSSVTHPYQPNFHTVSHRNPSELNTPMSDPYNLGSRPSSVMPPYQPYSHDVYHRHPSELARSHSTHQSFPLVGSQFDANMHRY